MSTLTLQSLMDELEAQAGLTKAAADDSDKDSEGSSEKTFPFQKKEDKKDDEKSEKKDDESEDKERTKEAQFQGAALYQEVMQKVASAKGPQTTPQGTPEMKKQASIAGKALADALLEKLANVGDHITENGIDPTAVPNKSQRDQAAMVAEHDAIINPTPTKDGAGNGGGTVNQIFDAIVADAMGHGAAGYEQVHQTGITGAEGAANAGAPNQAAMQHMNSAVSEEVEKVAATVALVEAGFDFNDAVNMVKQAEAEINFEQDQHTKQAAVASLMDRGVDFDSAVALVKQANALTVLSGKAANKITSETLGQAAMRHARNAGDYMGRRADDAVNFARGHADRISQDAGRVGAGVGAMVNPRAYATGLTRGQVAKDLMKNRAVQVGAGAGALGAVGGGAYAMGREKQAAVAGLTRAGVDFDTAVGLVNAKAQELYGA